MKLTSAFFLCLALAAIPGVAPAAAADPAGMKLIANPPVLVQTEGKLYHPVTLSVDLGDQTPKGEIQGKDKATGADIPLLWAGTLASGRPPLTFNVLVPEVQKETQVELAFVAGKETLATLPLMLKPVRHRTFYVLMHSHVDIGYTHVQPEIAKTQARNVARALELVKAAKDYPEGARFKWNLEVYWPAQQFLATATPEQKKEFAEAVRAGSIGIDAMHTNLLTGACRAEELLRAFEPATELGRQYGVTVQSMMISDVPGLTWGIVPALAQAGVRYISDGANAGNDMTGDRIGYARAQWENKPFWWVSPSGRERVLYWGAQGGYSIGHRHKSVLDGVRELERSLDGWGYNYDIVQLRWSKGDNGPADESVMPAVRDWSAKYAWPKLIIATTAEAYAAFEKQYGDKLPEFRGDFTPYWEDGLGSGARETGINRLSSDRLAQAETLFAMLGGAARYPLADFRAAWDNVFLWSEHTWGAHCSVGQPDSDFTKAQWRIKQAFALDADKQSRKLLADALALRGQAAAGGAVDVFNTASWPRTDLVTLPKEMSAAGDLVKDSAGKPVPSQRLSTGELAFLAADVPALGGRRYTVAAGEAAKPPVAATATANELRAAGLAVKLDAKTGAIASLRAAGIEADLVDPKAAVAVNEYVYLPGGNVKDAVRNGPATLRVKENGPLVVSVAAESDAPGCNKLTREVRLIAGLGRVELINTLDKKAVRAVEGVHFGFGFNVPNCEVRVSSPWAVARAEKDQLAGACRNWYSVERYADASNDQYGVTWATVEAPLMEIGGLTANLPRSQPNPSAYMAKIEPSATLYSWVMNNHWHTNYRADQEGPTTFRYAICPHAAGYDAAAAAKAGVEATEPLVVAPAAGPAPGVSRLTVDSPNVLISAMKPSNDGKAIIVRLLNVSAKTEAVRLAWSDPQPKSLRLSDTSEQPGAAVAGPIELPAAGMATLRAELP